ncbi:MAG: prolipoprotein diacylglyceryl transferase [Myxococcales bacterium]|nr:prolipoprotein diacylglyceryl transferase [Myxococcales bacterium]MCB9753517.1 prolipoprotein diacylglyceryl transferase [Myxococcales bacterium]
MYPVLFTLPGLGWDVQAYGVLMGLALLLGWVLTLRAARADRLPSERIGTIYVASVLAAVLTGRAMWLLQQPGGFDAGALLSLKAGGSSIIGALFAGLLVSGLLCRRAKIPWFAALDCGAPAFAIGVVLERVGAFLAGADFGRYVAPGEFGYRLHVVYPEGSTVFEFHHRAMDALRGLPDTTSAPVHPSQLYTAAFALLALALAGFVRRRRRFSGQVFFAVAGVYLAGRMLVEESLRFGAPEGALGPFRVTQLAAVGLLFVLWIAYQQLAARAAAAPSGGKHWLGGAWSEPESEAK